MQYLVQMTLVAPGRPTIAGDGSTFIEEYILPTLELCQKLQSERRMSDGSLTGRDLISNFRPFLASVRIPGQPSSIAAN